MPHTITATEICQMLKAVSAEYPGKKIHIVLNNVRYQKCELVTSLSKKLRIDLVYIPPYSSNLNPIERLWKFTKGKLRIKYYNDFKSYKDAMDLIMNWRPWQRKKPYNPTHTAAKFLLQSPDEELMEFIILPLSYRKKDEKIRESVSLAARIQDRNQQIFALAGY